MEVMTGTAASHKVTCDDAFTSDWDTKSKADAASLMASLTSFDFIVSFLVVYQMLSHMSAITVKLQRSTIDILEAYANVDELVNLYKSQRDDIESVFSRIYNQCCRLAEKLDVQPSMPRSAARHNIVILCLPMSLSSGIALIWLFLSWTI